METQIASHFPECHETVINDFHSGALLPGFFVFFVLLLANLWCLTVFNVNNNKLDDTHTHTHTHTHTQYS